MQKYISTSAGIIIIFVVAIIAFSGVFAYQYYSKISNFQLPISNESSNVQNQDTEISPFSIKVISPNGGEVFKKGDDIIVRWLSKNVEKVYIRTLYYDENGKVGVPDGKNYSFNQGECRITYEPVSAVVGSFTIKSGDTGRCGILSESDKIKIEITEYGASKNPIRDTSDNYFIIIK